MAQVNTPWQSASTRTLRAPEASGALAGMAVEVAVVMRFAPDGL
jgi:hypothetical protein